MLTKLQLQSSQEPLASSSRLARLRVTLINPPQTYPLSLASEYQSYFPVALASLGAAARAAGAEVTLIDCLSWDEAHCSNSTVMFGLSGERLSSAIESSRPSIVGISNPFSMFAEDTVRTARLVKTIDPRILVVVGGVQASLWPQNVQLLNLVPEIDLFVVGEGEVTFSELVCSTLCHTHSQIEQIAIPGLLRRTRDGSPEATPHRGFLDNLDSLSLPAYDLIDMDRMFANPYYARRRLRAKHTRCIPIHTSRGCPYKCNFCSVHSQVGYAYRTHSVEYIISHITTLREQYGVRHIHFEDDNLTLNPRRTRDLLRRIQDLHITWDTPNGIRADTVDGEIATMIAAAGATSVTIAVESGDPLVLNSIIKKQLDLSDVIRAADSLSRADVPTLAFFIIGFPGECEKDIRTTLKFAKMLASCYHTINILFVATPLPGTRLFAEAENKGYFVRTAEGGALLSGIRLNQTPLIQTENFAKADLLRLSQDLLDKPDLICVGSTIPMFWHNSDRSWRMAERIFPSARSMKPYSWTARV